MQVLGHGGASRPHWLHAHHTLTKRHRELVTGDTQPCKQSTWGCRRHSHQGAASGLCYVCRTGVKGALPGKAGPGPRVKLCLCLPTLSEEFRSAMPLPTPQGRALSFTLDRRWPGSTQGTELTLAPPPRQAFSPNPGDQKRTGLSRATRPLPTCTLQSWPLSPMGEAHTGI